MKSSGVKRNLEAVKNTILKRYDAEVHAQSSIEGALELRARHGFRGPDIARVDIEIFDVAYHIIGGGEEGDKTVIRTKEEADHSLQYMVAAALLDGNVLPAQYRPERLTGVDIQGLLRRIVVKPKEEYTARFPAEMCATVTVVLNDGRSYRIDKSDYEGFVTRRMGWESVIAKFNDVQHRLSRPNSLEHGLSTLCRTSKKYGFAISPRSWPISPNNAEAILRKE